MRQTIDRSSGGAVAVDIARAVEKGDASEAQRLALRLRALIRGLRR